MQFLEGLVPDGVVGYLVGEENAAFAILNRGKRSVFADLKSPEGRALVLQLVQRLARGPASVSELAKPLAISLPAVMQHLAVLEASGVVRSQKLGRVRTCSVEPKMLSMAERWIMERREQWEQKLDRLGDYLDATASENDNDETGESK